MGVEKTNHPTKPNISQYCTMNRIKNSFASLIQSALCALLVVSVAFGFASSAFALQVEAGPIWNNDDAKVKCPVVAQVYEAKWNGNWNTTEFGKMSVCDLELDFKPTLGVPGDVFAGPIWNQADAETKCPVAAYAVDGEWNGNWTTTVQSEMSVCGIKA